MPKVVLGDGKFAAGADGEIATPDEVAGIVVTSDTNAEEAGLWVRRLDAF
jgi:hypothetical protein